MRREPSDRRVRERATDPRGSFLVTAPAGSGKTALLAARFLRLLAEGGPEGGRCHPRRILAVTFTDKAAVEMRERISLWLARARDAAYVPETSWDERLLELSNVALKAFADEPEVLENPSACRISTFHSLCATIASRWPAEAEVPPGSAVLPDQRQEAHIRGAVREALSAAAALPGEDPARQALERRLLALNGNAESLAAKLAALLKERHRLGEAGACLAAGDLAGAERAVAGHLGAYAARKVLPARDHFLRNRNRWLELQACLEANRGPKPKRLPAEIPGCAPADAAAWANLADVFLSKGKVRQRLAANYGYPQDLPKSCKDFICGTPPGAAEALAYFQGMSLDEEDPTGLASLFDYLQLAALALGRLAPRIPGRGLDYLELEMAGLRALGKFGNPSESLLFFHETLRHVLVDEAQDLNPIQVALLGKLCEGWEPGESDHPRTLFVVGDPKQSIYRFRGSEVSLFTRMRADGIPRGGEEPFRFTGPSPESHALGLAANFRSHPRLVDFCNRLFEQILGESPREEFDEVAFEASEAGLESDGPPPVIRLAVFPPGEPGAGGARAAEAAWLASEVARLWKERPGESVAVLIPRRTVLGAYAAAFEARGVPVRMVEGEDLAAKPEIIHLHNLLLAMARPHDDVAWAGVLRAPWCRLPDRVLAELAPNGQEGTTRARPPWGRWREAVLSTRNQDVQRLAEKLKPALEDFGREPFDTTLTRAWEALGGPRAVASRYGAAGVANCLRYLEVLREVADLPLPDALESLGGLLGKAYTPPAPETANSPVQLMTIHKAKGLEFDHVFVPYLDFAPSRRSGAERHPFLMLTLPVPGRPAFAAVEGDRRTGKKNLAYEVLDRLEKGRELAEVKRLLYVAATRARRGLCLSGVVKRREEAAGEPVDVPFTAGKDSPLSLLIGTALEGSRPAPPFEALGLEFLTKEGLGASQTRPGPGPGRAAPQPLPFEPVRLPYVVKSPSEKLDEEEDHAPKPGEDDAREGGGEAARAYGVVAHRVLETFAAGGAPPPLEAVVAALTGEGLAPAEAQSLAARLLESTAQAWRDAGFARLREGAVLHPEWPLEQSEGPDLWVGRLDLVVEGSTEVSVVDYKTSALGNGQPAETFRESVRAAYSGQLRRYAGMVAAVPAFRGKKVRAYLLLTELPGNRLVEV